jgi:cysteinyl-tRNA synthetase
MCQNITDIDDKIILRSSERGIPFRELASKYEDEFFEDMAALGVQLPDLVTRVSEYVPEIVSYIQTLIEKGIAYEANGSVYFNTKTFTSLGHTYGKLMPENVGNSELLAEGEGALTSNDDKVNPNDFVLWKKTKVHANATVIEPSWESPWGGGRPGWHIECSVMSFFALEKLGGGGLDIHAGGVDLKFPHHENEVAQSEAFGGSDQWVNYWMHAGHLNIKGCKMSKSLKNFITIRDALKSHTARQIRMCFLMTKYNAPMDLTDGSISQAVSIDRIFAEFFLNVKAVLRRLGLKSNQHVSAREHEMSHFLEATKKKVREALADDFDTPRAITTLLELIKEGNKYIEEIKLSTIVLSGVARYITSMLRTFGLVQDSADIGFPLESASGDSSTASMNKEQLLTPFLDVLTSFREAVRIAAISGDTRAVLTAADHLRDDILPDLGVRMEDKGSGSEVVTIWKLEDAEVLRKEKQQKEEAKMQKELAKLEQQRKDKERIEKAKISPESMFLNETDETGAKLYSEFDETGMPTKDRTGEPLAKSLLKKLAKEYQKQKELHEKYLAKLVSDVSLSEGGSK